MNLVEIVVRAKDEATGALTKNLNASTLLSKSFKGLAGIVAGSGGLSVTGALGAAGVAVGAFGAVAKPELDKVQEAMSKTGKAGKKAWSELTPSEQALGGSLKTVENSFHKLQATLAPVVDKVVALGAKTAGDLLPALGKMATAGGKVLQEFFVPLDKYIRSATFGSLISQMTKLAQQAGSVLGPALVQLLNVFLKLFVQVGPAGISILKALAPAIVQIVVAITPTVAALADLTAKFLTFMAKTHLLIPLLGALALAFLLLSSESGIGAVTIAITLVVAAVTYLAHHWSQVMNGLKTVTAAAGHFIVSIWHTITNAFGDAVNFIRSHWQLIVAILTGPIGIATLFIINHWRQVVSFFSAAVGMIRSAWNAVYNAIVSPIESAYHTVVGIIDSIKGAIGSVGSVLGKIGGFLGFAHGGVVGAATGGPRSGMVMVGEHGRELVSLPTGSRVHSNPDTERMMSGSSANQQVVISFDFGGTADEDFVKMMRKAIRVKGGDVQTVLGH